MSGLWVNIVLVLFFILLGSFFAAAEIALVSLRESQVERLSQRGRRGRTLAALLQGASVKPRQLERLHDLHDRRKAA